VVGVNDVITPFKFGDDRFRAGLPWATNGLSICEIIFILFYQTVTKLQTFWIPNKFNASRKYKPSVLPKRLLYLYL